jgi:pimeloyl-ACP methyl ester carboxylesterase
VVPLTVSITASSAPSENVSLGRDFTPHTVEVQGFTVRYHDAGSGDPLIVLHGAGGVRFSAVHDALTLVRRVIVIEMPGFGEEANDIHHSLEDFAECVAQIVEAIGVQRFDLLGSSLGGAVALQVALAHPERIRSLILEAPAAFKVGSVSPAPGMTLEELTRLHRAQPDREPRYQPANPSDIARRAPLVRRILLSRPEFDQELADRLPKCTVRTLVVFGDRDRMFPAENGKTYRRLMPNCHLVLVQHSAHHIQFDCPETFSKLVADFLTRGTQFRPPYLQC